MPNGKAANTNFIIFGLSRPGREPTPYLTQGKHATYYTIDVVKDAFVPKIHDWLIDWLVFNIQRAIFQLYSGREHLKI